MEIFYVLWAFCILGGTLVESSWPNSCANIKPLAALNTTSLEGPWYGRAICKPAAQTLKPVTCSAINFYKSKFAILRAAVATTTLRDKTIGHGKVYNLAFPDLDNEPARIIASEIGNKETLHQRILAIVTDKTLVIHQCNVDNGEQFININTKQRNSTSEDVTMIQQYLESINLDWNCTEIPSTNCQFVDDSQKVRLF